MYSPVKALSLGRSGSWHAKSPQSSGRVRYSSRARNSAGLAWIATEVDFGRMASILSRYLRHVSSRERHSIRKCRISSLAS